MAQEKQAWKNSSRPRKITEDIYCKLHASHLQMPAAVARNIPKKIYCVPHTPLQQLHCRLRLCREAGDSSARMIVVWLPSWHRTTTMNRGGWLPPSNVACTRTSCTVLVQSVNMSIKSSQPQLRPCASCKRSDCRVAQPFATTTGKQPGGKHCAPHCFPAAGPIPGAVQT